MTITLQQLNKTTGQKILESDLAKVDNNSVIIQNAINAIPTYTLGTSSSKDIGTTSGNVPVLDASGKLDTSILPAIAITDTFPVSSEIEMLALICEKGDVAIRDDISKSFILKGDIPSVLDNWVELKTPTDVVTSVAGKTGTVTLTSSDIGLGNINNTSDANKPISTATQTALNNKANSSHTHTKSQITDFPTVPIILALTASEYSAIVTPNANTLYLIKV